MRRLGPAASGAIADAAGLNERYVREALGALATGGVVEYDAAAGTFHLPAEHAAWLTREAVPSNMASAMQWFSVLGSVEDEIVECFRRGGGLRYEQYKRFHAVMAEESYQTVVHPMLEHILPLVDGVKEKLEAGIEVMDLGCGSGAALIHLAAHFPRSRFTGYDLCEDAVARARKSAAGQRVTNVQFEVRDVAETGERGKYDFIVTFDAIHDQADPGRVLANIYHALKDDGVYLMQDISGSSRVDGNREHPIAPFIYTISCLHCMSVSLGQKGAGLGAMWGRELASAMLKEAGFRFIDIKRLPHDVINDYYIVRK